MSPAPASASPPPPPNQAQLEQELNQLDLYELFVQTEKALLRLISIFLLLHGAVALYDELIQLFYVFPHIPGIVINSDFSQGVFQTVARRSIIIASTGLLETIYGLVLIRHHQNVAHRLHLLFSIFIISISFAFRIVFGPIDSIYLSSIPTPPTFQNLISQPSFTQALDLFDQSSSVLK